MRSWRGLDVSDGLLAIARRRLPDADLRVGELDALPFDVAAFDAVVGVNAFQFAADPVQAFREAARVTRVGGRVVASTFAAPELSESTLVHVELSKLSPPAREQEHAPYSLSEGDNLERAMTEAGLLIDGGEQVPCDWDYASISDAVRGLLASAGGARAVEDAGVERVSETLERALLVPTIRRQRRHAQHIPVGRCHSVVGHRLHYPRFVNLPPEIRVMSCRSWPNPRGHPSVPPTRARVRPPAGSSRWSGPFRSANLPAAHDQQSLPRRPGQALPGR